MEIVKFSDRLFPFFMKFHWIRRCAIGQNISLSELASAFEYYAKYLREVEERQANS